MKNISYQQRYTTYCVSNFCVNYSECLKNETVILFVLLFGLEEMLLVYMKIRFFLVMLWFRIVLNN